MSVCKLSSPPDKAASGRVQGGGSCSSARFHSVSFSKPNPVWFGKDTPKKCVGFSKPIPVWFGKKKWNFARRRFQTKFRLVWKKLMTIVNLMKTDNLLLFLFVFQHPSAFPGQLQLQVRLWTNVGLSLFCNTQIWCRKSPVFCLPFWVVGNWIHSLFRTFSQILLPDLCHRCSPQNLPSTVALPK